MDDEKYSAWSYRQLDREWYRLMRLRELATGTPAHAVWQSAMDDLWRRMEGRAEADRAAAFRRANSQKIG